MNNRQEHPCPRFRRADWLNLNGEWEFEIADDRSPRPLKRRILVPFCPESRLSGVGETDFMDCVLYRRTFSVPPQWRGKRVLLRFGAADYFTEVWINGAPVGTHAGGYTPFFFDVTGALRPGENELFVRVTDDTRSPLQPSGKQSVLLRSEGCHYTRTTGIWQTVWLEAADALRIGGVKVFPDPDGCAALLALTLTGLPEGCRVRAEAFYEGRQVGAAETGPTSLTPLLYLPLTEKHLWEPGKGRLYDLCLTLRAGAAETDRVSSYFGLRTVSLSGGKLLVNGRPVFGRWVLDQGFYPDGIYTAPEDGALRADIEASLLLGFNGARLHEKVFEERYLYWADRLGYLVWDEFPNWGFDAQLPAAKIFADQWLEVVERDFSHPSVIGWCPFNETWDMPFFGDGPKHPQDGRLQSLIYKLTKAADPGRPVIDASGNFHTGDTDIFDVHDYEQDPAVFRRSYENAASGAVLDQIERNPDWRKRQHFRAGTPLFVSEYGGVRWASGEGGWGYGDGPKTEAEFLDRYRGLTDALLDNPAVLGFCYTQLFDVEQEQNGLMTYDRKFKFDPALIRAVNSRQAAVETACRL